MTWSRSSSHAAWAVSAGPRARDHRRRRIQVRVSQGTLSRRMAPSRIEGPLHQTVEPPPVVPFWPLVGTLAPCAALSVGARVGMSVALLPDAVGAVGPPLMKPSG